MFFIDYTGKQAMFSLVGTSLNRKLAVFPVTFFCDSANGLTVRVRHIMVLHRQSFRDTKLTSNKMAGRVA